MLQKSLAVAGVRGAAGSDGRAEETAGDEPEEEIEDGDDCTELCGLVFAQPEELVLPDD